PDYGYSGHSRGVWVEGTAGVALFERKLGNELNAVNLVAAMAPLFNEYEPPRESWRLNFLRKR
ncbi:hypothetical protein P4I21_26990, partial [Escherichia coli]